MLIPVFTLLAPQLEGATPTLIGIALGSYGLTQGLLQMPFGILSDHWGRKRILSVGLFLFIIGSVVGAFSHSIQGVILARILQGMGATGSVLIALLADLTPETVRTKAMAVIGMAIGLSFGLAMILSPLISTHYGLSGIFYLTGGLGCLGLFLLYVVIPNPVEFSPSNNQSVRESNKNVSLQNLATIFKHKELSTLNIGIFLQHFILTVTFYAMPLTLKYYLNKGYQAQAWSFYLPIMLCSFILMFPCIVLAEKKKRMHILLVASIFLTGIAQFFLAMFDNHWPVFWLVSLVYFWGFNILEASLPSLISKKAPAYMKGTAMGVYSTSQFMGIFFGGAMAGLLYQFSGTTHSLFIMNGLLSLCWLVINFKSFSRD
ncbi:MAG: MFS transporter [Legionella sp.]|nr:MFS transporter [Legionella sp.]